MLFIGCVNLWDTKVLRGGAGAHFHLQIHKGMDWTQIREQLLDVDVFIADNKLVSTSKDINLLDDAQYFDTDIDEDINNDPNEVVENNIEQQSFTDILSSVPLLPYYGVDFSSLRSMVLIVGGETEGISEESYKFAAEFNGSRLNVPLRSGVESLNTNAALGIITFEIKRQLTISGVTFK